MKELLLGFLVIGCFGCTNKVTYYNYESFSFDLPDGSEVQIGLQGSDRKIAKRHWVRGSPFSLVLIASKTGDGDLCVSEATLIQASTSETISLTGKNCGMSSDFLSKNGIDRGFSFPGLRLVEGEDVIIELTLVNKDSDTEYHIDAVLPAQSEDIETSSIADAIASV